MVARRAFVSLLDLLLVLVLMIFASVPDLSVHSEELVESTKKKLNDRGYFYANSNAGLGWTDRANREAFYRWRIIPRMFVDTNTRDLTSEWNNFCLPQSSDVFGLYN